MEFFCGVSKENYGAQFLCLHTFVRTHVKQTTPIQGNKKTDFENGQLDAKPRGKLDSGVLQ